MFYIWTIVMGVLVMGVFCLIYLAKRYGSWFVQNYYYHAIVQQAIGELQCFRQNLPLKKQATLNLHIVCKYALFDKEPCWQLFLKYHPLVDIEVESSLNLVFIVESKEPFKPFMNTYKTKTMDGRIVTHCVQQMYYHMYYSSPEYTEPDAILIYNASAMLENEHDVLHNEMSYRNMTSRKSTVLALFDTTEERLDQGVKAVKSATRSSLHVSEFQVTPLTGFHFTFIQKNGS